MRALLPITISLAFGVAAAGSSLATGPGPSPIGEMPTDRVIVRIKGNSAAAKRALSREEMAVHASRALGEPLELHRVMGDGAMVMRMPRRMAPSKIVSRARAFAVDGATIEIEPDRIAFPQIVPNDPNYGSQWNLRLEGINLPPAWDVTTGSASLVIAILDTGKLEHNDLAGRYVPGYDLVSDTTRSNDGTLRDSDATDPGDWVTSGENASGPLAGCPVTNSRWHGTLMAGVIAANGNNGIKIAGINWNSKLLPVRVVGKCGGYTSDIADGMRWAAGLPAPVDPLNPNGPTVPANPNPARLLNVSLAAASPTCETAFVNAIAAVTAAGATVVVSAGNASGAASQYAPGNCAGVITVGATDIRGGRPAYANTGDPIALSAPGGEGTGPGSVITLSDGGTTVALGDNIHVGTNGTSIAAAHVTGVASLLLSLRPNLTPAQVRDVLVTNARPFPANAQASGSFANCTTSTCGAGILNALAAITVVNDPEAGLPDVAAGGDHTLALKSDGTLYAWGRNDKGQLGDGTTTDRLTPIVVPLDGVTRIAAGGTARGLLDPEAFGLRNSFFSGAHSLAVRVDGSVWSWGSNSFGELGLGTIGQPILQPTRVPGLRDVVAVSAGLSHSLALTRNGTVWAWGFNTGGQLGTGTTVDQALPAPVLSISNVTSIAAGSNYSCATRSDGTVWCWGDFFPLNGSTFGSQVQTVPTQVTNFANPVVRAAAGADALHRVFYDPANFLSPRAIGNSRQGQTGVAPTTSHVFASPNALAAGSSQTFRQFAVGRNHTLGVDEADFVWAWGNDIEGQLGDGKPPGEANGAFQSTKVLVRNSQDTYRVAAGGDRGIGVRRDGSVYAWGAGLLGDGVDSTTFGQGEPVIVRGVGGAGNLDLGSEPGAGTAYFSPALVSRYGVPAGQTVVSNAVTIQQPGPFSVTVVGGEISVGCATAWTTNATLTSGSVVCLRGNAPVTISDSPTVVEVQFLGFPIATWRLYSSPRRLNANPFPIAPIAGAAPSSVVSSVPVVIRGVSVPSPITTTGGATVSPDCTGSYVASGVASVTDGQSLCVRLTAPATAGATATAIIAVGATNSIFHVTTAAPAFVAQPAIAAAGRYALALNRAGSAFAWGDNGFGQFGTVAAGDGLTPVPATPMPPLKAIDTNTDHAVAIAADGSVWTWGLADRAQAGDRTIYERSIPPNARRVVLPSPAVSVSAGAYHTLALLANGSIWGWGYNGDLQLTNACAALYCPQPVQIEGPGGGAAAVVAGVFNSYRIAVTSVVSCVGKCYTVVNGSPAYYSTGTFDPFNTFLGGGIAEIAISKSRSNTLYPQAHYLARTLTGAVLAWGANGSGQVGNGTTDFTTVGVFPPVSVSGLSNVTRVAAGANHSLALLGDGTVRAWGSNFTGALGDGTATDRLAPVAVQGFTGAIAIAAGTGSSFALKPDGTVLGWGYAGQMGRGTFFELNQVIPSPVLGVGGMGILNIGVQDDTVFAPQMDVPVSSVRVSNAITGNWAAGSAVSIATTGTGPAAEYSVGCGGTFSSAPGTIGAGQTVCIRLTSAPSLNTIRTATLTIAGVGRAFNVTTRQGDGTPDPFRIAPAAAQPLNTMVESEPFAITGIDAGVPITVLGGEISIGCNGTWLTSGAVAPDQPLCVRRVSAATPDTVVTATVSVGGVSADFHVITSPGAAFAATPAIAGYGAPLGLRSDGRLFGWGNLNDFINGTFRQRVAPELLGTLSGVTAISKSQQHSLALRSDGYVWAWGSNVYGELGDGTNTASDVPLRVSLPGPPAIPFVAVSAGVGHSMALRSDGVVYAWGSNTNGQLGDGTQLDRKLPVPMVALSGISAIAAGGGFSLAVKQPGGSVLCHGSCPGGSFPPYVTPFTVEPLSNVVAVSAGLFNSQFVLALRQDGVVLGWGENTFGQLGTTGNYVYPPLPVAGLPAAAAILAGGAHSLARTASGALYTFGSNDCGQLGLGNSPTDGTANARSTPYLVPEAAGAAGIAGGANTSFAVLADGSVLAWGCQAAGSLGNGQDNAEAITLPVRTVGINGDGYLSLQFIDTSPDPFAFVARFGIEPGADAVSNAVRVTGLSLPAPISYSGIDPDGYSIGCTGSYTRVSGTVQNNQTVCLKVRASGAFEDTTSGTLTIGTGNGTKSATYLVRTRRAPGTAPRAPQVALGNAHTLVLAAAGTVSGAGYNANGQLGNGTTLNTPTMQRVPGLSGLRRVAAGAYHSLAIDGGGTVFAWGYDIVGQLGQGSTTPVRATPLSVPGLSNAVSVAAGDFHSLALLQDGTVRAWGSNFYGQVGDGSTINRASPAVVGGALANVIAVAAGGFHSLALLADGTVRAWGANDSGQLGDNTTISKSLPTPVPGLTNVVAIAAGTSHSLALRSDGTVWAWGANGQGQLGRGNTTASSAPVQVNALGTNVGLIAAGGNHSLAVKAGGALFSWGANANGQLGDGLNASRTLPFAVATPAVATAIAAGARHSAALDASGQLYVWGDNFFGQVGNRSGNFSPHSANLNVLRGDSRISTGAGGTGTGTGTASSAGSSLLTIAGIGAAFAFDPIAVGAVANVPASYRNVSLDQFIGSLGFSTTGSGFNAAAGCASTLPPDGTCDFTLSFSSAAAGTFAGALRIDSDLVGAPEYRDLEAMAVAADAPSLAISGAALSFAPTTVGTVGGPAALTVTNKGSATLSIQSLLASSTAFGLSHDCAAVAPGASCTVLATYAPSVVGASAATATIVSNGGSAGIALYGTAIAPAYDAVPDAFAFASQSGVMPGATVTSAAASITGLGGAAPVTVANGEYSVGCLGPWTSAAGTISNGQAVCVRHVAGAFGTSTVTTLSVGGVGATFTSTSVVSQTLTVAKAGTGAGTVTSSPAGINCGTACSAPFGQGSMVSLAAAPGAGSTFAGWSGACSGTGSCNVTMDSAKSVTATFDFSASAGVLTANPASLDFGGQSMNTSAPARTMTLTNTGGSALTVNSVSASTYFAVTHGCAALAPGASCTASVTFTPGAEGALFGTLAVTTSAGTQGFSLAGTGERSLVTHYYNAILRRAPDAGGKSFWESERARLQALGASVNETWYAMATFFFFSAEYQSFNRDDAGFVTDLYNTFFNRAPDAGGLTFWTGQLAGGMPREVVLVGFMFSGEFQSFTQAIFGNTQVRKEIDTVVDFYRGLLSRLPDDDGFAFWVARFRSAQCAGTGAVYQQADSISGAFANSSEYQSRNRTNAQYVGDLYNAFLRRGGDLGGVQFWINEIASGSRTRDKVRQDFIASPEFNGRVLAIIAQGCVP